MRETGAFGIAGTFVHDLCTTTKPHDLPFPSLPHLFTLSCLLCYRNKPSDDSLCSWRTVQTHQARWPPDWKYAQPTLRDGVKIVNLDEHVSYCFSFISRPTQARHRAYDKGDGIDAPEVFGLGYLPPADSPLRSHPTPPGVQPMAGSLLVFHSESLETAWARVKEDVYYTAGVWDKEKIVVNEFITPPEGHLYGAD